MARLASSTDAAPRVVLVTGAARGLGRSFCQEFARLGFAIHGLDRDAAGLEALRDECRDLGAESFDAVVIDLHDEVGRAAMFDSLPHADIAVANAGILELAPILEITTPQLNRVLAINTVATFDFVRTYAKKAIDADLPGHALIVASTSALRTYPTVGAYVASKHALRGLALALEDELSGTAVKITTAYPAAISTGIVAGTPAEEREGMHPVDVARALLASLLVDAPTVRITEMHLQPGTTTE